MYRKRRRRVYEAEANAAAVELAPHRDNNEELEYYGGELPAPQKYDPTKTAELDSNYPPAYELPVIGSPGDKRDNDVNPSLAAGAEGILAAGDHHGSGMARVGLDGGQETQEANHYHPHAYGHGAGELRNSGHGYSA